MQENYTKMNMINTDYRKLVEPYFEEALSTLKDYVGIDSVYDETTRTKEHPFGQGVENALAYVAALGQRLGFKVDRCDNYVTELTYGEGDKILDIYAHSDVVPVNRKNWTKDPFALTLEDEVMYGRGTCDDKGPGLACLFAVKALMDQGKLHGYKLRFLFGGNEERDSLCLHHYFEELKKGYPTLGFSPDADYPLIYAEKSIYAYKASYPVSLEGVKPFALGDALNIVLGEASCELSYDQSKLNDLLNHYLLDKKGLSGSYDGHTLTFIGSPAHGSMPWLGVNAGLHLFNFLGILFNNETLKAIFNDYNDGKGEHFSGNYKDSYFSETSYNVGRLNYDGEKIELFVNLRFPAGLDAKKVIANVEVNTHATTVLLGGSEGFVADPKSDFIQILMNAYQEESGDYESKPLAIGGGTYARESKNSVAFGAAFINRDYRMHGDDEYFPLSDYQDNMQIYAHAIDKLGEYLRNGK